MQPMKKYRDFMALSIDELIDMHDDRAERAMNGGVQSILDQIRHKQDMARHEEQMRISRSMDCATRWIVVMTAVITIATIVNVVVAVSG